MLKQYFFDLFVFLISTFWSVVVLITELILIIKNGFAYFKSPKLINYPKCVNDIKYGHSRFIEVQTTKGMNMERTAIKLHYVVNGENNSPTLLLLHGFPEFWFSWRYQLTELGKTYRVIAMDLRGYGLSDKPKNIVDYQMKHLINDIKGLLDALDIHSIVLIGHDWGGALGWSFENAFPEMVEKYIALNMPEPNAFQMVLNKSIKQFLKSWYIFFFQYPYLPEWKLCRFDMSFISTAFNSNKVGLQKLKLSPDEIEAFKANMTIPGSLTAAINYYRASVRFHSSKSPKTNPRRNDKNRYMLIFGEEDKFIEIDCANLTRKLVPNIELNLLPGLSHWVQQDDPVLVNNLIQNFIEIK